MVQARVIPAAVDPPAAEAVGVADAEAEVADGVDNLYRKMPNLFTPNMKTLLKTFAMNSLRNPFQSLTPLTLALGVALSLPFALNAADIGKTFATPDDAVAELLAAASRHDDDALRIIFGPEAAEIENPDHVQFANDLDTFNAAASQRQRITHESGSKCVLEVGENFWPFPVPIVKKDGKWFFDTENGREEILSRRIGKNELFVLQTVRAYVEAQREYASKDRDGDEVLEYATKFNSNPGAKDGLYWQSEDEISPLGPIVAQAQAQGYLGESKARGATPEPFHGYLFKILTRQGKSAPGGRYDYMINGNMIGGFALVAWPAEYGESGIMTFIVNQQGTVYQKDLGSRTAKIAGTMKEYNPDNTWTISRE